MIEKPLRLAENVACITAFEIGMVKKKIFNGGHKILNFMMPFTRINLH